jgi:hypothetical protein
VHCDLNQCFVENAKNVETKNSTYSMGKLSFYTACENPSESNETNSSRPYPSIHIWSCVVTQSRVLSSNFGFLSKSALHRCCFGVIICQHKERTIVFETSSAAGSTIRFLINSTRAKRPLEKLSSARMCVRISQGLEAMQS